jgi:hypothetical protein
LLIGASAFSALGFHALRFVDVGLLAGRDLFDENGVSVARTSPSDSAYDSPGSINRLLVIAGALPDLCGLKVEAIRPEFQGGYTYLHRDVPLYRLGGPPRSSGYFNYVIALRSHAGVGDVRASDGNVALVHVRSGCLPDQAFSPRIS